MARAGYCRHGIPVGSSCMRCDMEREEARQLDSALDERIRRIVREEIAAYLRSKEEK